VAGGHAAHELEPVEERALGGVGLVQGEERIPGTVYLFDIVWSE